MHFVTMGIEYVPPAHIPPQYGSGRIISQVILGNVQLYIIRGNIHIVIVYPEWLAAVANFGARRLFNMGPNL